MHNLSFEDIQKYANRSTKDNWDEWQDYRRDWGEVVRNTVEQYNIDPKKVILIGAGNGNDVDIEYIEATFDEIVLVDIDPDAINRFSDKVSETYKYKFQTLITDVSGIAYLIKDIDLTEKSANDLMEYISIIEPKITLKQDPVLAKANLVINCSYSTQLISPFFKGLFFKKNQPFDLLKAITRLSNLIHTEIFTQLYSLMEDDGMVIHFSDTFDILMEGTNVSPVAKKILEIIDYDWGQISKLAGYPELLPEFGLVGSTLPEEIFDLYQMQTVSYLVWDFMHTEEIIRKYIVICYILARGCGQPRCRSNF